MSAPSARDVVEAIEITTERQDPSGAPWCPPKDAATVRGWVVDRSAALGGGIRRAVRLAGVMAAAAGGDFATFLYVRISLLRGRTFQAQFKSAQVQGRLAGIARVTETGIVLADDEATPAREFEIDFAQMPRLAALLDVLNNALGFVQVAKLLEPVTRTKGPRGSYAEVSRAVHAAINGWLSERLESANHLRQAHTMRTFLASQGGISPDSVSNDAILDFWRRVNAENDSEVDGFRLFKSAAAAMLRYREALRDSASERMLEGAVGGGNAGSDAMLDYKPAPEIDGPWISPLADLSAPSASTIKWLTQRECVRLENYLGGTSADASEDGAVSVGLMGTNRFDLAFWPTLLRADVFGDAQASIVGKIRKRTDGTTAVTDATSEIPPDAYQMARDDYARVRDQLQVELHAALAVLTDAQAWEVLILITHLAGEKAALDIRKGLRLADVGNEAADFGKQVCGRLLKMMADNESPALAATMQAARAASRKVSRAGFRSEDRSDADMLSALKSGCEAAIRLSVELDRLLARLEKNDAALSSASDHDVFVDAFTRMYAAQ